MGVGRGRRGSRRTAAAGSALRGAAAAGLTAAARSFSDPRFVLRSVGLAGVGVGAAFAAAPRLGLRLIGLESDGRGVSLLARLFASRDIAIGAATLLASRREELDPRWLELIALFQVGDLAFTEALRRSGQTSRRAWLTVVATAGPTLVVSAAARLRVAQQRSA